VDLRRQLRALEKRRRDDADRLDRIMREDPRWADPEFRRDVRGWDRRLRDEAKTRGLIGLM